MRQPVLHPLPTRHTLFRGAVRVHVLVEPRELLFQVNKGIVFLANIRKAARHGIQQGQGARTTQGMVHDIIPAPWRRRQCLEQLCALVIGRRWSVIWAFLSPLAVPPHMQ